ARFCTQQLSVKHDYIPGIFNPRIKKQVDVYDQFKLENDQENAQIRYFRN
ncbi:3130_t:CDS:1, partial [Dentiscutata heterogama]